MRILFNFLTNNSSQWSRHCVVVRNMSNIQVDVEQTKNNLSKNKQILARLRKKTGFPIVKCKQALIKNNYNFKEAVDALNAAALKEGWEKMESLSGRAVKQGLVTTVRKDNVGGLVEVNCESDFVAKTSEFQGLVSDLARTVLHHYSSTDLSIVHLSAGDMLKLIVPEKNCSLQDLLAKAIGQLKENITLTRGVVMSADPKSNQSIGAYTHPDIGSPRKGGKMPEMGRYGAMVALTSTAIESPRQKWFAAKGRDLAQHIVGMNPVIIGRPPEIVPVTSEENHDKVEVETDKQELQDSVHVDDREDDPMPSEVDRTDELVQQPFLLDANVIVQNWLDMNQFVVNDFVRYEIGGSQAEEEEES